MNESLLLHDKYFHKPSLIKAAKMAAGSKIIIPGIYNKEITRQQIIDRFLKNWLTEKQSVGMPWFNEMLDAFAIEILLQAQKKGIEKLLLSSDSNFSPEKTRYPLVLVPPKPEKPKKMKVNLEEVGGDLAFEAKTISLLQNVEEFDSCI